MKPTLLLDVDGVLCPFGYACDADIELTHPDGESVWVSVSNRERLHALADKFDICWCTAWEASANDWLGPWHELPTLEVVSLLPIITDVTSTWKLPSVQDWASHHDSPIAWIDDDLHNDAELWAKTHSAPVKLIRTFPDIGLTDAHVADLLEWADDLAANKHTSKSKRKTNRSANDDP